MAEMSDSEDVFYTQSSFNGSTDLANGLEKFVSSNRQQEDSDENCRFNIGRRQKDEHQEVSIGSDEKETEANKKKALKRYCNAILLFLDFYFVYCY